MPPSPPRSAGPAKQKNDENELLALFSTLPELPRIRSAKLLSGGNTNGVFRCSVEGEETTTVVAKHYYAYSVLFPDFKLSLKRSESEYIVMSHVPDTLSPRKTVGVPKVLGFVHLPATAAAAAAAAAPTSGEHDTAPSSSSSSASTDDSTLLVTTDAGASTTTLKSLLLQPQTSPLSLPTAQQIGRDLGTWLANLHKHFSVKTQEGRELKRRLEETDAKSWELWLMVTYERLKESYTAPDTAGWPEGLPEKVVEMAKSGSGSDGEGFATVVHGDFWTGNILVGGVHDNPTPATAASREPVGTATMTVVDLEMARPGLAWQDIGQMAAELLLATFFAPDEEAREKAQAVLDGFLMSYREQAGDALGEEDVKRALCHVAVHCVVWPQRTGWEPMERVWELQREAVGFLDEVLMREEGEAWKVKVGELGLGGIL